MIIRYAVISSLTIVFLAACELKPGKSVDTSVKIIFDTDMGSDCDDVGALALLHQFADQGKVDILGCIYSSGRVPYGAGVVDAINMYFGRDDIPVGACHIDCIGDPVDKMQAEKLARDTAAFQNRIIHNRDAKEQSKLSRSLLAMAEDQSVTYLTVGHTKGLYDLLVSESDDISPLTGKELITRKVDRWIALGALGANNEEDKYRKDWNFFFNGTAPYTEYLLKNFPKEIVMVNGGAEVFTGASLSLTPNGNIVRTAYRDWLWNVEQKSLHDQRPSWDLVTVYYAVEGLDKFFREDPRGWLDFDIEKGCLWVAGENDSIKNHRYISQIEGVEHEFGLLLNELISIRP